MIGQKVGRFEILSRIGAGGMGVVYQARDPQLDRLVAIKFLPPQFADDTMRQRFLHEAQAASALDHPAICTIYEIGETDDGQPYLAMAHYEGETLRQRLERGPLPPEQAIQIALQVGEGLAAAHARDIVHRDIKPANLFLTSDGMTKILDFGLAHRGGATRLTRAGTTMGTMGYMAPEQIRGDAIDHRVDVWSLGVVLYEAITGNLPFTGDNDAALLHAILTSEPEPPSHYFPNLAPGLDAFLIQALSKDPAARNPDMTSFLKRLRALDLRAESGTSPAAGAPTEAMPTPEGSHAAIAAPAAAPSAPAVAILRFQNLTGDQELDWLGGGIAASISGDLNRIDGVGVVPQTRIAAAIPESGELDHVAALAIANRLSARWAVWGSYQKLGDALRIVVDIADSSQEGFSAPIKVDGTIQEIFALQDQIVTALTERFGVQVSSGARERLAVPPTEYLEAYEYCARGLQLVFQMNPESFKAADAAFTEALELDPDYAMAHSGLGQMRAMRYIHTTDAADLEAAIHHLHRATELDPELGDPYLWLSYSYARQNRFQEAVEAGRRAIEVDPESPLAHYFLAVAHWLQVTLKGPIPEAWSEATSQIQRTVELAPRNQSASLVQGDLHLRRGRYEEALECAQRAAHIERTGDFEGALFVGGQSFLATILARLGEHDEAWSTAEAALVHLEGTDHVYSPAMTLSSLCLEAELHFLKRDYSAALPLLRRAREHAEEHCSSLTVGWFQVRLELLAARNYHRLNMAREARTALDAAIQLLEAKEGYDFSGGWNCGDGELLFEMAETRALAGQREEALVVLQRAVAAAWCEYPRLRVVPGLGALAGEPQLEAIHDRLMRETSASVDPAVARERAS